MNRSRETVTGYLFLVPSLAGFFVFLLFPICFSLFLAFCEWDLVSGFRNIRFVGLQNFLDLPQDKIFLSSLKNNFIFTAVTVPLTMAVALFLAILLNGKVYGRNALRLMYFMPYITTIVAVSVVWLQLFHPSQGPINQFLMSIGIEHPPGWLSSPRWALISLVFMMVWSGLGFDLIIYLAGLQGVPKVLYEAAEVDGAGAMRKFFHVTLPMLSPTTFFLFVTRIIHSFEVFAPVNIMTQGGPGDSTSVLVYHMYVQAFRFYNFGYGSAIAWVLFLIIFVVTLIQWKRQDRWVTYS
jgi:ABC-type sugar transport systems, permease components